MEGNKISQEESDKVVSDMTKRCEEVVERNKTSEAAAIQVSQCQKGEPILHCNMCQILIEAETQASNPYNKTTKTIII